MFMNKLHSLFIIIIIHLKGIIKISFDFSVNSCLKK